MARGDLRARTGRAAPWMIAQTVAGTVGQALAVAFFIWMTSGIYQVDLSPANALVPPTFGFYAAAACGLALVALTVVAASGGNMASTIASGIGVVIAILLTFVAVEGTAVAARSDDTEVPFQDLVILVTWPPLFLACGLSIAGFGYSLGRSVPGLKKERNRRADVHSIAQTQAAAGTVFHPEPINQDWPSTN